MIFTVVIIGEQVVLRFAGRVGLLYASINSTKGKNRKSIISVIIISIPKFAWMQVGFANSPLEVTSGNYLTLYPNPQAEDIQCAALDQ